MSESEIPMAEVVRHLREELTSAVEAGKGQGLRFELQELEVEMQVVVSKGASGEFGGEGGVKLWVVGKAAGKVAGSYESSQIQKVKLKLLPKLEAEGRTATVELAG